MTDPDFSQKFKEDILKQIDSTKLLISDIEAYSTDQHNAIIFPQNTDVKHYLFNVCSYSRQALEELVPKFINMGLVYTENKIGKMNPGQFCFLTCVDVVANIIKDKDLTELIKSGDKIVPTLMFPVKQSKVENYMYLYLCFYNPPLERNEKKYNENIMFM